MKQGRVSFIMDNLIAAKTSVPMIIVMENGMVATKPGAAPTAAGGGRGNSAFEEVVMDDLISDDRRHLPHACRTASIGRSPGFRWAAARRCRSGSPTWTSSPISASFSGAIRGFDAKTSYNGVFADAAGVQQEGQAALVRRRTRGRGHAHIREDRPRGAGQGGIKNVFFECPFAHEWQTWRYDLERFRSAPVPLTAQREVSK